MNNKNLVNGCIRYPRKMKILFWLSVFCAFACVSCLLYFCEFFLVCVYLPNKMNEWMNGEVCPWWYHKGELSFLWKTTTKSEDVLVCERFLHITWTGYSKYWLYVHWWHSCYAEKCGFSALIKQEISCLPGTHCFLHRDAWHHKPGLWKLRNSLIFC